MGVGGQAVAGAIWRRLRTREDRTDDVALNSVDPLKGVVGLSYEPRNASWGVELIATAVARKRHVDESASSQFTPSGHATFDLLAHFDIAERVRVNVGAFNLADEKYWEWSDVRGRPAGDAAIDRYTQPGLNASASASIRFQEHMTMTMFRSLMIVAAALGVPSALADDAYSSKQAGSATRYTFSWPLDGAALKPRGGTTKGPAVMLDRSESPAWMALQQPGLPPFERDRRAILAMAGGYRVTFDFLEVAPFIAQEKPNAPYQSWGTEKIYVDRDDGELISLVHILEMRVIQQDGAVSEPMVTKHWRQDWRYQPTHIVEHQGRDRWRRRGLDASAAKGVWSQTVYQVDESPRYASVGRWEHTPSFSTWMSGLTWRPLPRREWSVRDDYQVLVGTNRHTINASGWVQEENNLKTVLTSERAIDATRPYIAREYGVARYERIRDQDFAAANRYYERTKTFWDQVRERWAQAFASRGVIALRGPVDKLGLFLPLFAHADELVNQEAAKSRNASVIEKALTDMGALPK